MTAPHPSTDLHRTTDLPLQRSAPSAPSPAPGRGWAWAGLGAGLLGMASTVGAVLATPEPEVYRQGSEAVRDALTGQGTLHVAAGVALVAVLLLVPFGRGLVQHLHRVQPPHGWYADAVQAGTGALVAGLFVAVSLRYVAAGALPGGDDADYATATDSTAMALLGSQMQFAGWLPGLLVTGVLAYAAFRGRVVARWAGAVLGLLTAVSAGMTLVIGLPYSAGLVVPLALVVLSTALLVRRPA